MSVRGRFGMACSLIAPSPLLILDLKPLSRGEAFFSSGEAVLSGVSGDRLLLALLSEMKDFFEAIEMIDRAGLFISTVLVTIPGLLLLSERGTGTVREDGSVLLLLSGRDTGTDREEAIVLLLL